ncbi:uncharacterized protein LOC124490158 [Dermatophagoides farinae]|uniref:uncharacterized protein LOC124490158 n=1 Tax=Dermatophagoides farinae TaxID=6954 RepID=UPI003F61A456
MSTKNKLTNDNDIIGNDEIPLADGDDTIEVTDMDMMKLNLANITGKEKLEQLQQQQRRRNSDVTNLARPESPSGTIRIHHQQQPNSLDINHELNPDEMEEKERMIQQVLELQNTLDDLSLRAESVKEENLKLKSENQVLGQYIENLVSASSVFQSTSPKQRSGGKNNNNNNNNLSMKT